MGHVNQLLDLPCQPRIGIGKIGRTEPAFVRRVIFQIFVVRFLFRPEQPREEPSLGICVCPDGPDACYGGTGSSSDDASLSSFCNACYRVHWIVRKAKIAQVVAGILHQRLYDFLTAI